jgi:cyclic lactone autoinducer peptide
MKSTILKYSKKIKGIIPALAIFLAVQSVSSTCFFLLHQPNVPQDLEDIE